MAKPQDSEQKKGVEWIEAESTLNHVSKSQMVARTLTAYIGMTQPHSTEGLQSIERELEAELE